MTSNEKSSAHEPVWAGADAVESLAGAFHPHAIGVQEFSTYGLILDLRSRAAFEEDHVPGAVCVEPVWAAGAAPKTGDDRAAPVITETSPRCMPPQIAAALGTLASDERVLLYCGQGGLISEALAHDLRIQGRDVDVLPGGYANYRDWVTAGLDILPRLVRWRVVVCRREQELAQVLQRLEDDGEQVFDLQGLASGRGSAASASVDWSSPPALFESRVVDAIRQFDPRRLVWAAVMASWLSAVQLGEALANALSNAPRLHGDDPGGTRIVGATS